MPNQTPPPPGFPGSPDAWNRMSPQEQALWQQGTSRTAGQRQQDARSRFGPVIPTSGNFPGRAAPLPTSSFRPNTFSSASTSMPGQDQGRFRGVGNWIGEHGDDILNWGTAIANGYGAFRQGQREDRRDRRSEALERLAMEEYGRRAPLRDAAMSQLLDNSAPDTSNIRDAGDPTQGRYRRVRVGSVT